MYGKAIQIRPTSLEIPVGYNTIKVLYLSHRSHEGVNPSASFIPKKEYLMISVIDQLMTRVVTRMWDRVSGKLHKMPHVRNNLDPICGRVADTGDLTNPKKKTTLSQH
jgi:hypothetical protein